MLLNNRFVHCPWELEPPPENPGSGTVHSRALSVLAKSAKSKTSLVRYAISHGVK